MRLPSFQNLQANIDPQECPAVLMTLEVMRQEAVSEVKKGNNAIST
jgi:hypothetical protein